MIRCLATCYFSTVLMALSLIAIPAHADTIRSISMNNITFTGTNACSPAPCAETFNATWKWDATTNTLVAGSLKISEKGSLGTFALAYITSYSFQFYNDLVTPSAAVLWYFGSGFPSVGLYPLSEVYLYCWNDTTCASNFAPGYSHPTAGTVRIAAVPEPSTVLLMGFGLLAIQRQRRRLKIV